MAQSKRTRGRDQTAIRKQVPSRRSPLRDQQWFQTESPRSEAGAHIFLSPPHLEGIVACESENWKGTAVKMQVFVVDWPRAPASPTLGKLLPAEQEGVEPRDDLDEQPVAGYRANHC